MITTIRRRILNDFYRTDVKKYVSELQESQWDSIEIHKNRQLKKLAEILDHSKSVPYYKSFLAGVNIFSDPLLSLKNLPPLEKNTIIEKDFLLLHPGVNSKGRGTTSGSTGIGLAFHYDESMLINSDTLTRFFRSWFGIGIGDKTLKIWGRPIKGYKNQLKTDLSDLLRGMKTVDPWNLSSDQLRRNWGKIVEFKPSCIYGYATSVGALAKWIDSEGLQNNAKELGIKLIISTAETLLASDKQKIKEVFGCPVVEEYGSAEVSIIAHECLEGNFHIASESLFLECVDDAGHEVPYGQPGHILVTSFVNRAQPLLRYRLGDFGILLASTCQCGRGLPIMKLTGAKTIELIKTKGGKTFSAEIIDYINLALLRNENFGIKQFRVTQKDLTTFAVEVVPNSHFNKDSETMFTDLFIEQLGEKDIKLFFDVKEKIAPLPSGKLLYFMSEIS